MKAIDGIKNGHISLTYILTDKIKGWQIRILNGQLHNFFLRY